MNSTRSHTMRKALFVLALLPLSALAVSVCAQDEAVLRDMLDTTETYRNRLEMGILSSGADARHLDDGVFNWDYLIYSAWYYQLNERDTIRLRHQYWDYLDRNYMNLYSVRWRRTLDGGQAVSVSGEFSDDDEGTDSGTVYLGYEGTALGDMRYFARAGIGYDSDHEWTGSLRLEGIKPITARTLLRLSNSYSRSTSGFYSDTVRLNLIQLLHERLALNLGYRFYMNHQADISVADDVRSHEGSAALTWQARSDLYLTGGYSHYRSNQDLRVDSGTLSANWQLTSRLGAVAAYRAQFYDDGPLLHGFQLGFSYDF